MCLCQGPSHGGSYMDEGMFCLKIGLPPCIVSGDCLAFVLCFLDCLLFTCAWFDDPGDTGLYWYVALVYEPLEAVSYFLLCLLAWCFVSHDRLLCLRLEESVEACICWCFAGFPTILLLIVTVLRLRYFGYWYVNQPWDSGDLHNWYCQPMHRFIHNLYSSRCWPTSENLS